MVVAACAPLPAQRYLDPSPVPQLEAQPGANLYWHQPGAYWEEDCNQIVQTDCFGYSPRWYALGEFQTLMHDNLRSFDMATVEPAGPSVLNTGIADGDMRSGFRVLLGRTLGSWYRVEASYYGAFDWSEAAALRNDDTNALGGTGRLFSPLSGFGDPPTSGLDYNRSVVIRLTSELDNVELNLRRRMGVPPGPFEASFLVGLRYMRIEEQFSFVSESTEPPPGGTLNDVLTRTGNDMMGVQVGLTCQWLLLPRSWIDWDIKGAVFSNSMDVTTDYVRVDELGQATQLLGRDEKTSTSGALDVSLMLNCQITRAVTFRVGYYAVWLGGVSMGPDQLSHNATRLPYGGPVLIDDDGKTVYHGPTIGFVAAW